MPYIKIEFTDTFSFSNNVRKVEVTPDTKQYFIDKMESKTPIPHFDKKTQIRSNYLVTSVTEIEPPEPPKLLFEDNRRYYK